jgi:hypothetical protein
MKYKDSGFLKVQERQERNKNEFGFLFKAERKLRREQDLKFKNFYLRCLRKDIDRDWWDCLSNDDKSQIYRSYINQKDMFESYSDLSSAWASFEFFDSWDKWFEYIRTEFKIDKAKYRELKLKKLGV